MPLQCSASKAKQAFLCWDQANSGRDRAERLQQLHQEGLRAQVEKVHEPADGVCARKFPAVSHRRPAAGHHKGARGAAASQVGLLQNKATKGFAGW